MICGLPSAAQRLLGPTIAVRSVVKAIPPSRWVCGRCGRWSAAAVTCWWRPGRSGVLNWLIPKLIVRVRA